MRIGLDVISLRDHDKNNLRRRARCLRIIFMRERCWNVNIKLTSVDFCESSLFLSLSISLSSFARLPSKIWQCRHVRERYLNLAYWLSELNQYNDMLQLIKKNRRSEESGERSNTTWERWIWDFGRPRESYEFRFTSCPNLCHFETRSTIAFTINHSRIYYMILYVLYDGGVD